MRIKTIVVACSIIAASSTLTIQAQQGGPGAPLPPGGDLTDFFLQLPRRPIEGRVVRGMPYSAEILSESIQTLGDGNRIVKRSTGRVYRDTEGRVRREDDRASSTPSVTITDPVARTSFTLDPEHRTAREGGILDFYLRDLRTTVDRMRVTGTTSDGKISVDGYVVVPFKPSTNAGSAAARGGRIAGSQDVPSARAAGGGGRGGGGAAVGGAARGAGGGARGGGGRGNQPVEEQLQSRTIEGVLCSGVRRTTTIPQGEIGNEQAIKIVSEEWTSVDLQVLVKTDFNDPRSGRSTYELSKISRRDPDSSLFKVPSDYTIQKMGGRGRGGRQ